VAFIDPSPSADPPDQAKGEPSPLVVTRILQNPLGQTAPPGATGDIVRVSDGEGSVYLTPREYDDATDAQLRYLLAQSPRRRRA
jgi:hypothetical protein